jgi:hypothetical protein
MRTSPRKSQRGQAMTEFVAAMAMFIPLIFGVVYTFKYGDIKHQAVQASRYAAMERALDPHLHESDQVIRDETVARFFRDGGPNQITANDKPPSSTSGDDNPNWGQLNGGSMLGNDYSQITVKLSAKNLDSLALLPVDLVADAPLPDLLKPFKGLSKGYGTEANVEVPVANITGLPWLGNSLKIGATTVIAGDPWNAGGAADVAAHLGNGSVPGRALKTVTDVLNSIPGINELFDMLAGTKPPQFGCVKPDVVTDAATNNMAVYNSSDDPNNPSNPNDKCY